MKADKQPRRRRSGTLGLRRAVGVKQSRLQVLLADDTISRLKVHCAHEGASVSAWLENFVRPYLLREGKGRSEFRVVPEDGKSEAA